MGRPSGFRYLACVVAGSLVLGLSACSKSGKGGNGTVDDVDQNGMGDGNVPVASAGKELADVNFEFDSSALSSGAQAKLKENARYLLDNPGKKVAVEGHCDERGTTEYNMALGERRARSAYDYLRSMGVKGDQMSTISYGNEVPLNPAHTEDAWSENRRAHFSTK